MCIKGGNNDGVIQLICKVRVSNFWRGMYLYMEKRRRNWKLQFLYIYICLFSYSNKSRSPSSTSILGTRKLGRMPFFNDFPSNSTFCVHQSSQSVMRLWGEWRHCPDCPVNPPLEKLRRHMWRCDRWLVSSKVQPVMTKRNTKSLKCWAGTSGKKCITAE